MNFLNAALQRTRTEDSYQTRLFFIIEGLIALSFTIESIIEIFLLPENAFRWLLVIIVINCNALITFYLARSGYTRQAAIIFVSVLWVLFTGLAITESGVRAPTVDIAYLVIILIGGLLLGERTGFLVGILCSLTLLGLTITGVQGFLPVSQVKRNDWTTWEADVFYLAIVMGLQYLTIHSIKEALDQAHRELVERRRMEANLRKAEEDRAQSQMHIELHRLLERQLDQERLKIARDLHDGPIQDLIGATFTMQSLIEDAPGEQYKQDLTAVQTLLQDQVASLRMFAGELRSPTLTKFGLPQAIHEHLEKFQAKYPKISARIESAGEIIPADESIRLTLFRIYQETMNNIVKHAQATQVVIQTGMEKQCAFLKIHDNGVGFTLPDEWMDLARHSHLGLVGMRERAEAAGGSMNLISQVGAGTTVEVTIPLNGRHAGEDQ